MGHSSGTLEQAKCRTLLVQNTFGRYRTSGSGGQNVDTRAAPVAYHYGYALKSLRLRHRVAVRAPVWTDRGNPIAVRWPGLALVLELQAADFSDTKRLQ
jgi:hypothetical protein